MPLYGLGYDVIDETGTSWWMDGGSTWHRGVPPTDWWQAEDGRWHPPGDDDLTAEMWEGPPAGGAHLATGPRVTTDGDRWGWPGWTRTAVLASVVVVAGVVIAVAALGGGGGDPPATRAATVTTETTGTTVPGTPGASSTTTPTGDAAPALPGDDTSTTVPAPTTTAAPQVPPAPTPTPAPTNPPPDQGVHPGAECSPEGATAVSDEGVPMTCTRQKCHGAPFDSARWRRTTC